MSRCWAHNADKIRCELDAGHDQLHRFSIAWSDEECYEPGKNVVITPVTFPNTTTTAITTTLGTAGDGGSGSAPVSTPSPQPVSKCVACNHQHKGRNPCPVGSCDCYEFIG